MKRLMFRVNSITKRSGAALEGFASDSQLSSRRKSITPIDHNHFPPNKFHDIIPKNSPIFALNYRSTQFRNIFFQRQSFFFSLLLRSLNSVVALPPPLSPLRNNNDAENKNIFVHNFSSFSLFS
jgi:hypothetical protein